MFAAHTSCVGMYIKEERSSGKNHTFDNGGMPYGSYFNFPRIVLCSLVVKCSEVDSVHSGIENGSSI